MEITFHVKKWAPSPKGRPQCEPGSMVHTPNAPSVWVHTVESAAYLFQNTNPFTNINIIGNKRPLVDYSDSNQMLKCGNNIMLDFPLSIPMPREDPNQAMRPQY